MQTTGANDLPSRQGRQPHKAETSQNAKELETETGGGGDVGVNRGVESEAMKQGSVELGISGIEECFDSLLFEDT
jgi:hypothetical protein